MIGDRYRSKLRVPEEGLSDCPLFTKSGLHVARGYNRIVIGGRGPYVEFSDDQVLIGSLRKVDVPHYYYDEWRTKDFSNVKFYHQMATVGYADYLVGMWYVTPFELFMKNRLVLIMDNFPKIMKEFSIFG